MMKSKKSIQTQSSVLGIDPGFDRCGVAVADEKGLIFSSCIVTDRKLSHEKRLLKVGSDIRKVIKEYHPKAIAMESLFFNKNTTNALKVSEARGIAIYEAAQAEVDLYEYSPQAVKIAVTGYGRADKSQVESMARKLMKVNREKILDDEMDAIALCITHLATKFGI